MTRFIGKVLILTLFMSHIAGCGSGGGGGGSTPIQSIQSVPLMNIQVMSGYGNLFAVAHLESTIGGTFREQLKLFQQDSTKPDQLLDLGTLDLGIQDISSMALNVTLSPDWAVVTMNNGIVDLVSLSTAPNYSLAATLLVNYQPDRCIASGNLLLTALNTSLEVYDISNPGSPILKKQLTLSAANTSLVALPHGFYVITQNGYGYVDTTNPSNITLAEAVQADIKQSINAYLFGSKLYIGGPSRYAGKSKIARVDVTTPTNPAVELINDQIPDAFGSFSYDNLGNYYIQTEPGVSRYNESSGSLTLTKKVTTGHNIPLNGEFYAYNDRFYLRDQETLLIYRMP